MRTVKASDISKHFLDNYGRQKRPSKRFKFFTAKMNSIEQMPEIARWFCTENAANESVRRGARGCNGGLVVFNVIDEVPTPKARYKCTLINREGCGVESILVRAKSERHARRNARRVFSLRWQSAGTRVRVIAEDAK